MPQARPKRNVHFRRLDSGGPFRHVERLFLSNRSVNAFVSGSAKLFLACLIWPRFVAPFRWRLTRYPLPLANLHPAFAGFKILQLSDLHVGTTRLDYLMQVFDRALAEKPDLVVITGDFIHYDPAALAPLKQLLRRLSDGPYRPPEGTLAIFGNHDYHEYSWRHVGPRSARRAVHKRLVRIVQDCGIRLLRNEQHVIARTIAGGNAQARFTIVGLDEMWTGRANADVAFRGLTPADPVLCLQHNPDGVEFLMPYPWQYMLCGHSHGGQANLPLLGPVYVPMEHRQYLRGFFQFSPAGAAECDVEGLPRPRTMFVSTGLGYTTPIRLRCPPEATVFSLEPG
jgi:uncharacterized protein